MAKITEEHINSLIVFEEYQILSNGRTTICCLTLKNGFIAIGDSSVIDIANFNEEIGQREARKNAIEKIWALEGYSSMQKDYENMAKSFSDYTLDFGGAIRALKEGKKVARKGWNGKNMWLSLSVGPGIAGARSAPWSSFWSENNAKYAVENGGFATVLPCITMKTATGEILMGWLASQTDMLAVDWFVVE